ncbi:hypothetical protein [Parasitella parasitica]|uniref:Uncharacterized protein n=1 Tax=Parasitella parasitica TaxID=35722 RepID=A0A0B7NP32_9FUNG|nr:hypothetical protein [Parasitella parasitica]
MKELLDCNKYNQVLCLCFDDYGWFRIYRTSNRLIAMQEMTVSVPKEYNIDDFLAKRPFTQYFDIYLKVANQQTIEKRHTLLSTIECAIKLKQFLIQDEKGDIDGSQFIFCLPPEWAGSDYKTALRSFYLKAGWITEADDKNRLLFSTYTESLVGYLQHRHQDPVQFERERRYVLGYIREATLRVTCFQMQSAKELITVSQRLAASDLLLVPTTLDEELMCQLSFDDILRTALKHIVIKRIIDQLKSKIYRRKRHASSFSRSKKKAKHYKSLEGVRDVIENLAFQLLRADYLKSNGFIADANEWEHVTCDVVAMQKLFKEWTWNDLVKEVFKNADIKRLLQQFTDACTRIQSKYNSLKGSPEGIQNALSSSVSASRSPLYVHDNCYEYQCEGAMQKPYKIIQIANALLPPSIWNDNSTTENESLLVETNEVDLIPPNSFYAQAYIRKNCIDFILNKAVTVSLVDGVAQKSTFTAQEETVKIQTITDSVCDKVWIHLEMIDFEGCGDRSLRECCTGDISMKNYQCFQNNLQYINIFANKNLDDYQQISISNDCKCTLNISNRMLIEVGLIPAIENIAAIITSTLVSNSFFGRYNVSALIVIGDFKEMARVALKETIQKRLQVYQKKHAVFVGEQELVACESLGTWAIERKQILGKGSYVQLSDTNYTVRFRTHHEGDVYEYNGFAFKKIKGAPGSSESIVLRQAEYLAQEGVYLSFIFKGAFLFDAGKNYVCN